MKLLKPTSVCVNFIFNTKYPTKLSLQRYWEEHRLEEETCLKSSETNILNIKLSARREPRIYSVPKTS